RARWYLGGGIAVLGGCAVLIAWAVAAGMAGGEAYRNELFFMQTAGRVVDSFDHARPWWWYATVVPALLLPWLLWPRAWQALGRALDFRRHPGVRLLACWLPPVFIGFSMVSGKQTYYLLPELGGVAILLAAGFARLVHHRQMPRRLAGPWPLALGMFGVVVGLLTLPHWLDSGLFDSSALVDLSRASPWFAVAAAALGGLLLLAPRNDVAALRHISAIAMLAACLAYVLFANTFWVQFDLRPAAARISALQAAGIPVAHFRGYENQFQYLGRLTRPLDIVRDDSLQRWSESHPQGRIIHYESSLSSADLAYAELVQPFRSTWLIIEPAAQWVARRQGLSPPPPATPAERFPPDYWPYRRLLAPSAGPANGSPAAEGIPNRL
ncbi:MAG: glycosyl transferase, partial [Xanthomonadales bacterium]|nr:glycosyl transferase [Xanthomonadales bacterium]